MARKRPKKRFSPVLLAVAGLLLMAMAASGVMLYDHVRELDKVVQAKFDGKRWALPAIVYARPLEIYQGLPLSADDLEEELLLAGYRQEENTIAAGGYERHGDMLHVVTREFAFADGLQPSQEVSVYFTGDVVAGCFRTTTGEPVPVVRVDPARIGSFLPESNEDRVILDRSQLPQLLVETLLAVEDRSFLRHRGVDPKGILRAVLANLRAGGKVEGGSTLTQQLVKNFYLTSERTFRRKFNEMIMAILLEHHYSKDDILTAYANEIFLGQDGRRAVHGFGLASQFYFRRDLADLSPSQFATLVALVKGPSYFNPYKSPDRCLGRRNNILDRMLADGLIDSATHASAIDEPILEVPRQRTGFNRFPAFLDLVRRQLRQNYRPEDLTNEGLAVLTTLDPRVQQAVERELSAGIERLEQEHGAKDLQGAVIITNRDSGEIVAVAGGRLPQEGSFNRVLDARRPIGSLIKPAIYLTALDRGYALDSPLSDTAVSVRDSNGSTWKPGNYDHKEHGRVMLCQALARSYNLATVRLGLDLGLEHVQETVRLLGVDVPSPIYPSFLLGTLELSPVEVSRMYQTLAAGGFFLPQRAINGVLASDRSVLERYALSVEQRFGPVPIYLLNYGLQLVVRQGTAASLERYLPKDHNAAGKTGTTDDLRDSWFAGFTGDRLGVVWIGRDDNGSAGLTGSAGAMTIWGAVMQAMDSRPLELAVPSGIDWMNLNPRTMEVADRFEEHSLRLPYAVSPARQLASRQTPSPDSGAEVANKGGTREPAAKSGGFAENVGQLVDRFFDLFR